MKTPIRILVLLWWTATVAAARSDVRPLARIPFDRVGTYVVLDVHINDNPPLRMLLDTGIGTTLITELGPEDSLQFRRTRMVQLKGLGIGDSLQAWVIDDNRIGIGKTVQERQQVMVLQEDLFDLSRHTGSKINGIVGADFFQDRIVRIDYSRERLLVYDTAGFTPPKGFTPLPIHVEDKKMFVHMMVEDDNGRVQEVLMLIDTGAELTAWLRPYGDDPVRVPARHVRGYIGRGLSGEIEGAVGRIRRLWLGDYPMESPVVSFPDSISTSEAMAFSDRNGTVGSQILSRFDLCFDRTGRRLYIRPNGDYRKPFDYNLCGIEVAGSIPSLNLPEVISVWKGSSGEEAGVRPGDLILEINGESGFQYTIGEIKGLFHTYSRSSIRLSVLRDGNILHLVVKPRRTI